MLLFGWNAFKIFVADQNSVVLYKILVVVSRIFFCWLINLVVGSKMFVVGLKFSVVRRKTM